MEGAEIQATLTPPFDAVQDAAPAEPRAREDKPSTINNQLDPTKRDLRALTGLRFLAALGVVFFHFARNLFAGSPYAIRNIASSGYVAVSLFFLLSGFVLAYSYMDRTGEMRGDKRSFYSARFARIYPAYLLGFLLAAPTNVLWSLRVNHLASALLKLAVAGVMVLTLQQAWIPWTAWSWNFPAWSVSVEAFFYLVFPFLAPRLFRLRASLCLPVAIGLWMASLAVPCAFYLLTGVSAEATKGDYLQMAVEFNPLLRLPEFLIGILLGRAFSLGAAMRPGVSEGLTYLSGASIIGVLACSSAIPHPLLANGLLAPLFAILIYSLAAGKGLLARLLSLPPAVLLGEASYGIYILQLPVSYILQVPPPLTSVRTFALYCAALIAVAVISWRFIESPLRVRIRGWLMARS